MTGTVSTELRIWVQFDIMWDTETGILPERGMTAMAQARMRVPSVGCFVADSDTHEQNEEMATLTRRLKALTTKSPNDVVILSAVRSPITRAFKGGFKDAWPEDILAPVSLSS